MYRPRSVIWKKEGGDDEAAIATDNILKKCLSKGFPFVAWNEDSERMEFLHRQRYLDEGFQGSRSIEIQGTMDVAEQDLKDALEMAEEKGLVRPSDSAVEAETNKCLARLRSQQPASVVTGASEGQQPPSVITTGASEQPQPTREAAPAPELLPIKLEKVEKSEKAKVQLTLGAAFEKGAGGASEAEKDGSGSSRASSVSEVRPGDSVSQVGKGDVAVKLEKGDGAGKESEEPPKKNVKSEAEVALTKATAKASKFVQTTALAKKIVAQAEIAESDWFFAKALVTDLEAAILQTASVHAKMSDSVLFSSNANLKSQHGDNLLSWSRGVLREVTAAALILDAEIEPLMAMYNIKLKQKIDAQKRRQDLSDAAGPAA